MKAPNTEGHEAREVTLIEVVVGEGKGVENDPVRRVVYYHRPDGECVARRDQWKEEQKAPP